MRSLLFLAAAVAAGSSYAADPGLLSLAIPDSQFMAGVNVGQVLLSPLGQYSLAQTTQLPDAGLEKMLAAAGFDPRRDLTEILVSSTVQPGGGPSIAMARGTFDIPKILEASRADGAGGETYKGVPMIIRNARGTMAFPDSTIAIIGDAADVRAAIDRMSAPTPISSALAVEVNQLSATEDFWFVSMAPLSQFQPQGPGSGQGPLAAVSYVQQASGGVKLGANVVATLQALSQTDQDAAALAMVLKSLPAMAQMGGSGSAGANAAALLQNMTVSTDGPITKVSLSIPEAQIEQMMQAPHADRQATIGVNPRALAQPPVRDHAATAEQSVPSSADATPQRIRVGNSVQKAKLIQQAPPVYPPLAMQARISGVVRLDAVIAKDGTVESLTLVSGHPVLVPSAMEAAKQWVYQPTLLNGQPVEVVTQVEVNFALEE